MKARENSVWKGHGWSYWTASGRDSSSITSFSEVKMGSHNLQLVALHKTITPNNLRMVIQPILHHNHNH